MNKSIFAVFLVTLLIFCLGVVGYAADAQDFSAAVADIDDSASYSDRLSAVEQAEKIYAELSDEEKLDVVLDYQLLLSERDALCALEGQAETFISGVNVLSDISDLDEREEQLNMLLGGGVYFADETYPGITDALQALAPMRADIEARVEASVEFMNAVDTAVLLSEDDYLGIKEALVRAENYLPLIDHTYDGVSGAKLTYDYLRSVYYSKEEYTKGFLEYIKLMAEATDYKTAKDYYDRAITQIGKEDFLPDYEGVDEAMEKLAQTEEYFKECIAAANIFISAVGNMSSNDKISLAIINAYSALLGVDITVEGVSVALRSLEAAVESYNSRVESINETFEIL